MTHSVFWQGIEIWKSVFRMFEICKIWDWSHTFLVQDTPPRISGGSIAEETRIYFSVAVARSCRLSVGMSARGSTISKNAVASERVTERPCHVYGCPRSRWLGCQLTDRKPDIRVNSGARSSLPPRGRSRFCEMIGSFLFFYAADGKDMSSNLKCSPAQMGDLSDILETCQTYF